MTPPYSKERGDARTPPAERLVYARMQMAMTRTPPRERLVYARMDARPEVLRESDASIFLGAGRRPRLPRTSLGERRLHILKSGATTRTPPGERLVYARMDERPRLLQENDASIFQGKGRAGLLRENVSSTLGWTSVQDSSERTAPPYSKEGSDDQDSSRRTSRLSLDGRASKTPPSERRLHGYE
ncbi:hypothetical protein COLO4_31603 [Corchorus olitorius]|uniref:Uncharacterized protein n=1 Tax=Corchorus olitorius TaxID=93759 RepID=A0A1R3H3W7_9ROSI|nr:hypothetical protein COLO4_31603 [Corchorus olitorius]